MNGMNMRGSRLEHVSKNFIWAAANSVVVTIFPFLIRTLLIHNIGVEYGGVSSLFSSVFQILNLADFGIENAILSYLYYPAATGDNGSVCYLIRLLKKIYRIIGVLILTVGCVLIPFIPYLVKGKEYPEGLNLYLVYVIYLINACCPYLTLGYRITVLRVNQRVDLISVASVVSATLMYSLQIISLTVCRSYYLYSILLLIGTIGNVVLNSILAERFCPLDLEKPEVSCGLEENKAFHRELRQKFLSVGLAKLRNLSRSSFDSIVISSFLGLSILAKYNNYCLILMVPVTLISIIHGALVPSLGNSIALRSERENYAVVKTYAFFQHGIVVVFLSCLLNLYQPFVVLWIGVDYLLPFSIVVLLCIYFYLYCLVDINEVLKESTGVWEQERILAIVEATANLCLNIVLVRKMGVAGVILATIVTILFINLPVEYYCIFRMYFKANGRDFFLSECKHTAITIGITVLTYLICSEIPSGNFSGMFLRICAAVLVPACLFLVCYRDNAQLRLFFGMLSSFLKKWKKKQKKV